MKPELGDRCVVGCFKLYLSLIPIFFALYGSPPRFSSQLVGIHILEKIVPEFCKQAGFNGRFINHSGQVTCATQLFEENVDEQLIKLQTGHCSDAVNAYKRPTKSHALQVSNILQPPLPKKAAKLPEMEAFGGYHAENKENSVVPAQSNSQQSSVMHSSVTHFTNSYGTSPTFVFNFGK